jgi:hypothetical protein
MKTWYDNLTLLFLLRARSSPFADEPVPFDTVIAERDRALERVLDAIERRAAPGM